jgi:hypothetical protein
MKIKRSPRKAHIQMKDSVLKKPFPSRFWTIQMRNGENLPHQYSDAHCVFIAVAPSKLVKLWVVAPNGVKLHASAFVRLGQIPFHSHHHEGGVALPRNVKLLFDDAPVKELSA